MTKFKKVIVWGHKNDKDTLSYVLHSYYKAFQALGYDAYHFEDNEARKLKDFDFENCLFLTEDQAQKNIPLIKSAKYILHHVKLEKYDAHNLDYIHLGNYLKYCDDGISANHKENTVERINRFCFWDAKSKTLYQPWATDLLPHEIDTDVYVPYDEKKRVINYIGDIYPHNRNRMLPFIKSSKQHGIKFKTGRNIPFEKSAQLVKDSYITVDIRGDWHIECGYLPCRVFKNISYGKFIGVNSPHVGKIFGDFVAYEPDETKLFDVTVDAYRNLDPKRMKEAMEFVKNEHTYINRAENLLKFV